MRLDYSDIIDRLGQPLWHDDNGAPRYSPFTPNMATVYDDYVALLEVACQSCDQTMIVAATRSKLIRCVPAREIVMPSTTHVDPWTTHVDPWEAIGDFHYGDPPRHNTGDSERCLAGPTMNSIPIRVIEFWGRDLDERQRAWNRFSQYEIAMPPLQDDATDARG